MHVKRGLAENLICVTHPHNAGSNPEQDTISTKKKKHAASGN